MRSVRTCWSCSRWACSVALLSLCLACAACSSSKQKGLYPVHGQVIIGGKPARGALVVFHPLDNPDPTAVKPHAVVERDGTFSLFSYQADDGALPGTYAVTIQWQQPRFWGGDSRPIDIAKMQAWKEKAAEWRAKGGRPRAAVGQRARGLRSGGGPPSGWGPRPDPVPARYRNPQTSDLRVEVTSGPNELAPFNLSK